MSSPNRNPSIAGQVNGHWSARMTHGFGIDTCISHQGISDAVVGWQEPNDEQTNTLLVLHDIEARTQHGIRTRKHRLRPAAIEGRNDPKDSGPGNCRRSPRQDFGRSTMMNTPILKMTAKEAEVVNRCYAVLVDKQKEEKYTALERLSKLLARIVVRNIRAGQAQFSNRKGDRQG